jgi:hypothetical protein
MVLITKLYTANYETYIGINVGTVFAMHPNGDWFVRCDIVFIKESL